MLKISQREYGLWLLRQIYLHDLQFSQFMTCSPHLIIIIKVTTSPTERCSSPGRTRNRCSKMEYMMRPIPNDGSITEGTNSSTTNTMSYTYTCICADICQYVGRRQLSIRILTQCTNTGGHHVHAASVARNTNTVYVILYEVAYD